MKKSKIPKNSNIVIKHIEDSLVRLEKAASKSPPGDIKWKDLADVEHTLSLIKNNKKKAALKYAEKLDTAAKDWIPMSAWRWLYNTETP